MGSIPPPPPFVAAVAVHDTEERIVTLRGTKNGSNIEDIDDIDDIDDDDIDDDERRDDNAFNNNNTERLLLVKLVGKKVVAPPGVWVWTTGRRDEKATATLQHAKNSSAKNSTT
jgi:hypothetical protein